MNHDHLFLGNTSPENDTLHETNTNKPHVPSHFQVYDTKVWKYNFLKDIEVGYSQMAARWNLQHIVKFY